MQEIWKEIEGTNGMYQVSNLGNVKSFTRIKKGGLLKFGYFSNGYLFVHIRINGKRRSHLVHRLVASAFLPNPQNLPQVNHKDENKTNNSPDNLMVFYTKADHTSFHQHNCDMDTVELLPCGSWISKSIATRCPICGNPKSHQAKTCRDCYKPTNNHSKKISNKPTKEELFNILQQVQGNFTKVGRQYNVTDNAVRKWCKSYNLPSHSRDYK